MFNLGTCGEIASKSVHKLKNSPECLEVVNDGKREVGQKVEISSVCIYFYIDLASLFCNILNINSIIFSTMTFLFISVGA